LLLAVAEVQETTRLIGTLIEKTPQTLPAVIKPVEIMEVMVVPLVAVGVLRLAHVFLAVEAAVVSAGRAQRVGSPS
jgi:hypothetical protein